MSWFSHKENYQISRLKERIEELEAEQTEPFTEATIWVEAKNHPYDGYCEEGHALTLRGEVDAIIKHLGIDVSVSQKKCTGPTVKVTKVAKGKK